MTDERGEGQLGRKEEPGKRGSRGRKIGTVAREKEGRRER